jgi:hypothetical protein
MNRVTCSCGAIYVPVEPKARTRGPNPFKCLNCGKELISAQDYKVGDLRLVSRPEPDRE